MANTPTASELIKLAEGFEAPQEAAWLELVKTTLKGADFDKRLVSRTADHARVEPLYTAKTAAAPFGGLISPRDAERPWDLRTVVSHPDPKTANRQALHDLENGAASILLKLDPSGEKGVAVASKADLATALDGVLLELAPVALDAGYMGPAAADWLAELGKLAPQAPLAAHMDPLTALAETGASPGPIESHLILAAETAVRLSVPYAKATWFLATGRAVHEAGGTEGQELGFALSAALAYAKAMQRQGLDLAEAFRRIVLGLAADGQYFTTLAKVRAARLLWAKLTTACGVAAPAKIEARSSRRMLAALDPWTNLLRLTAAGFGAAVGGADAVILAPFTDAIGAPTDFARRQARNTQLVLMEESHLGKVADPAAGAWFLETLTDHLARAGWTAFQTIEAAGGIIAALESGDTARAVAAARFAREVETATRKAGLIGVSEFPDLAEAGVAVEPIEPARFAKPAPSTRMPGPDSKVEPLAPHRVAEPFEALRRRARALTTPPKVLLATLGTAKDFAARVGFARNLFAVGGLAAETGPALEAADAPAIAVICGTDEAYAAEAESAARALKAAGVKRLYLAGRGGAQEAALKAAGVDDFVYAGCDLIAALDPALALLEAQA